MDLVHLLAPDALRHLATALIVRAAGRECSVVHCAPSVHCNPPNTSDSIGYSGQTVCVVFITGFLLGVAALHSIRKHLDKTPSAATIALRKSA